MTYNQICEYMEQMSCVARKSWNGQCVVCKQIEATIPMDAVGSMKSLPDSAKQVIKQYAFYNNLEAISYTNQYIIVWEDGTITSFMPTREELLAEDWIVIES